MPPRKTSGCTLLWALSERLEAGSAVSQPPDPHEPAPPLAPQASQACTHTRCSEPPIVTSHMGTCP